MIVSDTGQARVFLINIIFGILCVVLFDVFYVLTKKYGNTKLKTNLFDICCFAVIFCVLFFAGVKYNFGALRYYQILGIGAGVVFWGLVVSSKERFVIEKLYEFLCKAVKVLVKIGIAPILLLIKIIFVPIDRFEKGTIKIGEKYAKKIEKYKKRRKKHNKTVKKRLKML